MIEQQMSERMHDAVLDEPPLGFDPVDVVTRAATRQRRRRAMTATVAATVAAVATVSIVGFGSGAEPVSSANRQPATTFSCPADQSASDGMWSELLAAVGVVVAERAPDSGLSTTEPMGMGVNGAGDECDLAVAMQVPGADPVPEQFQVNVANHDSFTGDPAYQQQSESTLPDGTVVRVYHQNPEPLGEVVTVAHFRHGGTVVSAWSSDLDRLSVEEMTAIVTDPRLTF